MSEAYRVTLTTGLTFRLRIMTPAQLLAWVKENRAFIAMVEVWIEEKCEWRLRWTPAEGWI